MHLITDSPQWEQLLDHAERIRAASPRELTSAEDRLPAMSGVVGPVHVDWSRQMIDAEVLATLVQMADWRQLPARIAQMFDGMPINTTEHRSVLHTALRAPAGDSLVVEGTDVIRDIHATLTRMSAFAEGIRTGATVGATGKRFTDIVNIGIGGSDLGPAMAAAALKPYGDSRLRMHFVSNVDPTDITTALASCTPEQTLVLVASKTFTTAETMANAHAARAWLVEHLGESSVATHMAAMSTALDATTAFGIDDDRVFGFWDWVGGRYSVGSAIGLSLMISIGADAFADFLGGMREVDVHFRTEHIESNIPALLGLLAVWNRNGLGIASTAVLPYEQLLARFPAYLQQLTMESNGKSVASDGTPLSHSTGGVYWGEPGTNGQHSFHQLLHQGTDPIECHVIAFAKSQAPVGRQHEMLLANALAQAELFATGRTESELRESGCPENLINHKSMPGGRPTTVFIAEQLDPRTLGALIAIYEHSVFTQGVLWGINSFDQWGVEYGKEVASKLLPRIESDEPATDTASMHPSTAYSLALLARLRA